MSVARITTLNFKSKEGADQVEETYKNSAPTEFAEAEQLLEVRVDDTTLIFVSLYADNDAMERASAARSKRMDINKDIIESMDGKTGNVILTISDDCSVKNPRSNHLFAPLTSLPNAIVRRINAIDIIKNNKALFL